MCQTNVCSLHDVNDLNPKVNPSLCGPSKQPLKKQIKLISTNPGNVLDSEQATDYWFIDCG